MPATLKFVKEGSFCENDINGPRAARVIAILSGFTPSAATTAGQFTANEQAKNQASAIAGFVEGDGFPGYSSTICACTSIRADPTQGVNFRIVWEFERPIFGATSGTINTLYVVDEQRTMVEVERIKLPHVRSGGLLEVGWKDPWDPDNIINVQTAAIVVKKPALQMVIAGRFNQIPTYGASLKIGAAQGSVNTTTWNGFARGFWLFAGCYLHRDPGQNIRTFSAVLVNMLDEDWSTYVLVRHPSGITPTIDLAAVSGGYPLSTEGESGSDGKGYIRPQYQKVTDGIDSYYRDTSGIVRIGQYPALNFSQVFASLDPTP